MGLRGALGVGLTSRSLRMLQSRAFLWATLLAIGVASYAVHIVLLTRYAAPPSADHGIYLADAHALLGTDVTTFGSAYPPIFLLILAAFMGFLNPVTAVTLVTPLPVLLLPFPFYRIVSRYATKPWAVLGAFLFVFNEGYSEMTGWGGGPDLLAIAFMLASAAFFLEYLDAGARRSALLAGLFAGLVVGTHHLTALVYAGSLLTWMALEVWRARRLSAARPFVELAVWSGLFSLPFVPYYLGFGTGIAPQLTPFWPDGFVELPGATIFLFREAVVLWIAIVVLTVLGGAWVLEGRREGHLFLSMVAVSLVLAVGVIQDNPTRAVYYLYIPLLATYPAAMAWISKVKIPRLSLRSRRTVAALVLVFVVGSSAVLAGTSLSRMSTSVDWYHAINQPELDAMDWVRANTPADAVVATPGVPIVRTPEGTRYAWWIQGYAERRTFSGGTPIYAALGPERDMVNAANAYFAGDFGQESGDLRWAENGPSALENPGVAVSTPYGMETAVFMSDADTTLYYTVANGSGGIRTWSPYPQVQVVHPEWSQPGGDVLQVQRSDQAVSFVRNETLVGRSVVVSLQIRCLVGPLVYAEVPVWAGWWMHFASILLEGDRVVGTLEDGAGDRIPVELTFAASPVVSASVKTTTADPRWGQPGVVLGVKPYANQTDLSVRVTITFPSAATGTVTSWSAPAIGSAYGIGYIFLNAELAEMYWRFMEDHQRYRLVYQNPDILIFQTLP